MAVSLDADLLVLLTNVGGLFTANPRVDPDARRASPSWPASTTRRCARADGGSDGGTGGMASKLEAARLATAEGTAVADRRRRASRASSSARWPARTSGR